MGASSRGWEAPVRHLELQGREAEVRGCWAGGGQVQGRLTSRGLR